MSSNPEDIFSQLQSQNAASKGPKNPKLSARQKYNRRKIWLSHALDQMEISIADLLSQEGAVYKRAEIDTLKNAIEEFRKTTELKAPEPAALTQEEIDGFTDMLSNLQPWEPPSKEELASLYASLELAVEADDDPPDNDGLSET
ncbi:hypothetical protein [Rhizobium sp. A37_96]